MDVGGGGVSFGIRGTVKPGEESCGPLLPVMAFDSNFLLGHVTESASLCLDAWRNGLLFVFSVLSVCFGTFCMSCLYYFAKGH